MRSKAASERRGNTLKAGLLSESQGQNLALAVLYVPCSLDSGPALPQANVWEPPTRTTLRASGGPRGGRAVQFLRAAETFSVKRNWRTGMQSRNSWPMMMLGTPWFVLGHVSFWYDARY